MEPPEVERPGTNPERPGPRLGRRGYLGLATTALAVGSAGWLRRWLGESPDRGDRSFVRRAVWRETLPAADWDERPLLTLYRADFDADPTVDRWHRAGRAGNSHDLEGRGSRLAIVNDGSGPTTEAFAVPVDIKAPWVAVAATVSTIDDASRVAIGFAKDGASRVAAGVGPDGPELAYRFGRREVRTPGVAPAPDAPFEVLGILMGDRFAQLTREPGEDWSYQGHLGWRGRRVGVDLFEQAEWAAWEPTLWIETGRDGRAVLDDVRVCHTLQFGIRDPTVVTYPDGSPVVRNGELYLTATCGSIDHRGYQAVLGVDVDTYDVTMHGALWAESVPGYISNYVASHLMYDPDGGVYRQCWSGFGNGPREPFWNQKCWVSRTTTDLLGGTHVVPCELMHLPRGWSGRQHDPFVIRDEGAGVWRCVHTSEAIHRITVSETTDDSWTGGWTTVASYRDLRHQIEGGKFARIDGEIVLSYADQGSRNHMVTAAYPDPAADRRWIDVDVPTGDVAPHPSLVVVDAADGRKQLLITMDGETVYGLGEPTHGGLLIYEASGEVPP